MDNMKINVLKARYILKNICLVTHDYQLLRIVDYLTEDELKKVFIKKYNWFVNKKEYSQKIREVFRDV